MASSGPRRVRARSGIPARLLRPIGASIVLVVALAVGIFWWTCEVAEEAALAHQRLHVSAAMQDELDRARDKLSAVLSMSPSLSAFRASLGQRGAKGAAARIAEFESLLVLSPELQIRATTGGGPSTLTADRDMQPVYAQAVAMAEMRPTAAQDPSAEPPPRRVAAAVQASGGRTFITAAIQAREAWPDTVTREDAPDVIVGIERFDGAVLARLGAVHNLTDLAIGSDVRDRSGSAIPLADRDGRTVAYLTWAPTTLADEMRARVIPFVIAQVGVALVLFCAVAAFIRRTTRDLAEREVISKDLLSRDPLSGLANRLLFNERLDRALAQIPETGSGLAVMFIDLDRFKDVNDTYGHQAGDDLIQLVAKRLAGHLGGSETLARFGGDEFAVIQPGVNSVQDAAATARRILDDLMRPFQLAHSPVTIGASIGVALAPGNGRDRETLMRLADTALYQAKSEGRNRSCFYERRMDEALRMRKVVEEDLRGAIDEDRLVLHYQPLYSCDGETILGLEALVRWPHPVRGLISPGEFIPVAEERGLIIPLGEWVLRRACQDGMRWPGLHIAVNVSAIQFRHRDFVASVVRTIEETGFDPSRLELELTEGVIVADADAAEAAMMDLRALGVHLALDDFGTGYSSLIYLRRFAFDKIKIDRSFLESMEATGESAILVHSIVHLGRALGLTVTAEGVETREQHRFLQALGCHELQGYLFSRPVPAADIDRLLAPGSDGAAASAA